jgi:1,4-dihydroxy-2-naphthoyl-CoA hydrolase
MSIWFKPITVDEMKTLEREDHMSSFLGIEFTRIGDDELEARMPVDNRTRQPQGILHGGASVVLAETVGGFASHLVIDPEKYYTVGLDINANHLRQVKQGYVKAVCRPLKLGRTIHVWDIRITDDREKLVCISRLTMAVIHR